jgi:thymidylate synthase ThyX
VEKDPQLRWVRPEEAAQVTCISQPTNALQTIAQVTRGWDYDWGTDPFPPEEVERRVEEVLKGGLGAPLEMPKYVFYVENVTRSFTHQLVRTRTASFVHESHRFIPENATIRLLRRSDEPFYVQAGEDAVARYWRLRKVFEWSAEDARDVLPHNVLSNIWVGIDLNTLRRVWSQRMTVQAQQGEWQRVLLGMVAEVPDEVRGMFTSCCTNPEVPCMFRSRWDRDCPGRMSLSRQHLQFP